MTQLATLFFVLMTINHCGTDEPQIEEYRHSGVVLPEGHCLNHAHDDTGEVEPITTEPETTAPEIYTGITWQTITGGAGDAFTVSFTVEKRATLVMRGGERASLEWTFSGRPDNVVQGADYSPDGRSAGLFEAGTYDVTVIGTADFSAELLIVETPTDAEHPLVLEFVAHGGALWGLLSHYTSYSREHRAGEFNGIAAILKAHGYDFPAGVCDDVELGGGLPIDVPLVLIVSDDTEWGCGITPDALPFILRPGDRVIHRPSEPLI